MAPPIKRHTYGPRRTTFDPKRPLYARRAFGTHQAGELFDPTGIAPMRLAGMFSSRLLTHDAPPARAAAPPPSIAAPGFAVPPTPTDADGVARIRAVPDERVTVPAPDPKPGKRPRAGA